MPARPPRRRIFAVTRNPIPSCFHLIMCAEKGNRTGYFAVRSVLFSLEQEASSGAESEAGLRESDALRMQERYASVRCRADSRSDLRPAPCGVRNSGRSDFDG